MATMDLRTNQEVMGVRNRYSTEYGSHTFKTKETFEEADIKGNNNIFNSLKTEANSHDPSSLYQVKCPTKRKLEVDNSLFSYSSFKKAMDLRTHNRTLDGGRRTIFEDAEHFAKNHCYKLLPITFEQVDETIIQSEHNYSLFSLTSESEPEEDCSRMMDYSQIKEKNYKRRRTKFREGSEKEEVLDRGNAGEEGDHVADFTSMLHCQSESFAEGPEDLAERLGQEADNSGAAQPLDLSGGPPAEDEKTDPFLRERPDDPATEKNEEIARLDSDKENVDLELTGIRVTITRPDEKENYQPCDLFLNDIARLVPWLIDKDCFEVDILDRTCDGHGDSPKHRLYYVISESTWRLFQTSNERVILTNDRSLGQPLRNAEKNERPSYLVFDQFSLAKCLAEYCQEIGGCFEYTCVEERKDGERKEEDEEAKSQGQETEQVGIGGEVEEKVGMPEQIGEEETAKAVDERKEDEEAVEGKPEEIEGTEKTSQDANEESKEMKEEEKETTKVASDAVEESRRRRRSPEARKVIVLIQKAEGIVSGSRGVREVAEKRTRVPEKASQKTGSVNKQEKKKGAEKREKGSKTKKKSPIQPKPKNNRITTRWKSTSESETSQKSDERVNRNERRKREASILPEAEPPRKLRKSGAAEDPPRMTRSGKVLESEKTDRPAATEKKSAGSKGGTKKEKQGTTRGVAEAATATARSLRSQNKGEKNERAKEEQKKKKKKGRTITSSRRKTRRR